MPGDLDQFAQFQFPKLPRDCVAVYVVALRTSAVPLKPIYVGKTETSLKRRMGHYLTASKHTAADFVVGAAIAMLQDIGREVLVCYHFSSSPSAEEARLIRCYTEQGVNLLNSFSKFSGLADCPKIDVKTLQSDTGRKTACEYYRIYRAANLAACAAFLFQQQTKRPACHS